MDDKRFEFARERPAKGPLGKELSKLHEFFGPVRIIALHVGHVLNVVEDIPRRLACCTCRSGKPLLRYARAAFVANASVIRRKRRLEDESRWAVLRKETTVGHCFPHAVRRFPAQFNRGPRRSLVHGVVDTLIGF